MRAVEAIEPELMGRYEVSNRVNLVKNDEPGVYEAVLTCQRCVFPVMRSMSMRIIAVL
jgi:hypothetical protein